MDLTSVRPRPSPDLRCAFCHDRASSPDVHTCVGCGTLTHAECRVEARGACPSLGCAHAPRPHRRRARRTRAGGFAGWWATNRVLVIANSLVWTLAGVLGATSALLGVMLLQSSA